MKLLRLWSKTLHKYPQATGTLPKRPEWDILLCCARPHLNDTQRRRLADLFTREIDFDYLLQVAIHHKMMPLLWWHLRQNQSDSIPPEWLKELKDLFDANSQRNVTLMLELLRLVSLLESNGILTVPFKGPVLAVQVYGDLALRQFSDLDILVRPNDVPRARDVLRETGYRFVEQPRHPWTWEQESALLRNEYVYMFHGERLGYYLELHWQFAHRYFGVPLASEGVWERLTTVSLAGRDVRTLSPEDLLIYQCTHGAKDLWKRLEWISGLAQLAEWPDIRWNDVLERARALRCERILLLGLQLAHVLLETPLPPLVTEKLAHSAGVADLVTEVQKRIFVTPEDPPKLITQMYDEFLFQMGAKDSLRDRFRYCFGGIIQPQIRDWDFVPLPRALFPLYSILRPIRLFSKFALRLIK